MKKQKKHKKQEEGFILVVSLLILAVSVAIGGGAVYNATKQVIQSKNWERSQQALYAAEAGVEAAKKWLQDQYNIPNIPAEAPELVTIKCYKNFTNFNKNPRIVKSNSEFGKKVEETFLENFTYTYYISKFEGSISSLSGSQSGTGLAATGEYATGGIASTDTTFERYLTFICGNGPNSQRVNLEVLFRADH